jgi:hypothetical protein
MGGTTVALSSAVISNTGAAIAAFELAGAAFYLAKATLQYVRLTKELAESQTNPLLIPRTSALCEARNLKPLTKVRYKSPII